jgi:hypothetical protein
MRPAEHGQPTPPVRKPAARPTAAYASETLADPQTDLYYWMRFKLLNAPMTSTNLRKFPD